MKFHFCEKKIVIEFNILGSVVVMVKQEGVVIVLARRVVETVTLQ